MTTHSLAVPAQIILTALGAFLAVTATTWVRSRTVTTLNRVLRSRELAEWAYAVPFWGVTFLLGVAYNVLGLIPPSEVVGLTFGSTMTVLGVLWPPYMQAFGYSPSYRSGARVVAIAVGVMLLIFSASRPR